MTSAEGAWLTDAAIQAVPSRAAARLAESTVAGSLGGPIARSVAWWTPPWSRWCTCV